MATGAQYRDVAIRPVSPYEADTFRQLTKLIDLTVHADELPRVRAAAGAVPV
ncbi:hypothetical protein [Streptomyces agglomeratus]|uniref:hypothetical protein n=1 Tax=Streptomyces agglomeratus TaxID=285458 RepID=UPI001428B969|nr:hypothetical protein [Streptomyces agglomeratus]